MERISVAPLISDGQHQIENWSPKVWAGFFFLFVVLLGDADGNSFSAKGVERRFLGRRKLSFLCHEILVPVLYGF